MLPLSQGGDDPLDFAGHACGGVDHQQDQVGVLRAGPGRSDHRPVESPSRLEDARRIDQQDLRIAGNRDAHQPRRGSFAPWG